MTRLSKTMALILFIVLPIIAFLFGIKYQKFVTLPKQRFLNQEKKPDSVIESKAITQRINEEKNEILLVSGILNKSGTVEWSELYMLPDGIIDTSDPGDYTLKVLSIDGEILYKIPFFAAFFSPESSEEIDSVPFGYAVPYQSKAQIISLEHLGKPISNIYITSKMLRDAVLTFPDQAFLIEASKARKELNFQIDKLEIYLKEKELTKVKETLQNDFKINAERLINDNYNTTNPLEYTKDGILNLISNQIKRLEKQ